jgi:hypothetical protein
MRLPTCPATASSTEFFFFLNKVECFVKHEFSQLLILLKSSHGSVFKFNEVLFLPVVQRWSHGRRLTAQFVITQVMNMG